MQLLQTVIAFFVAVGLLVLVHELGHYLVARLCNVKVVRFSLGIGKVLYSKCFGKDKTEWAISMLPIGGYVMMLDSREQDLSDLPEEELKREFNNQNVWRRIAIVLAGAIANFLFGILILTGVNMHGIKAPTTKLRAVQENTAAWQAGLRGGEYIVSVNGAPVRLWSDLRWEMALAIANGDALTLGVADAPLALDAHQTGRIITIPQATIKKATLQRHFTRQLGIDLDRPSAILRKILPAGPADLAGLQAGDQVLYVDGQKIADAQAFIELMHQSAGKTLSLTVLRGSEQLNALVTPQAHVDKEGVKTGRLMAEISAQPEMTFQAAPFFTAMGKAITRTAETIYISLKTMGKMIAGDVSLKSISGPITIADYAGQTARLGMVNYLSFVAFISISIGVMNLLPIPVLDGGLLLYYSMELLTGRRISERAGKIAQNVGLAILLSLMALAIFNDVVRLAF